MTTSDFTRYYWKQFIMMEKEFRQSAKYVAIAKDNFKTYSDFFIKLLLQIGSEVDVIAKALCEELNASSKAERISVYAQEILAKYPEIERVTVKTHSLQFTPWKDWSSRIPSQTGVPQTNAPQTGVPQTNAQTKQPEWWDVYNDLKHNRFKTRNHYGEQKEAYKFATLEITLNALAGLYILELYLYQSVTDKNPHLDAPLPGSRLFIPTNEGWENKSVPSSDTILCTENGDLCQYEEETLLYSDL